MFLLTGLRNILEQEYNNLSLWYFISFICGITTYFTLDFELNIFYIVAIFTCSLSLIFLRKYGIFRQFISGLIIAFACGLLVAKLRILNLNIITIERPIIAKIDGIVESIKPTIRGMQIILNQIKIHKLSKVPKKIRISIPTKYTSEININDHIKLLAKLYKPKNRVLPGGYDFGFYAYLLDIGATGYAMSPPEIIAHNNMFTNSIIYKIRKNIYNHLLEILGPVKGNFAAAILLGETKAIDRQLMKEMRQSGIAHILCVSGLHLSLVAMILFIFTRFLLNLSDFIAFNYNIKFIAAICSLIGSYCYLELSNMQIAATRAFIMTAIFIYAIIVERSVYSLRSLAIAASIILSLNPEYIFHPSFQLSFVAVLSLIAGYEFSLKNQWILGKSKGIFAKIKFYISSNIYSSFLASIVTAPVVINQFYIFSTYSIPMNLIAVPIMSFFLMPLSIISLLLSIFAMDKYVLKLLGFFIDIIINSVKFMGGLPYSVWYFGYISKFSIIIFLFGFFWLCLWQSKWRLFGLIIISISFILMLNSPKPDLIFDINLNAIGVKNQHNKLEIYANKMPEFNRLYWANWFGQADAAIFLLKNNIFTTKAGQKIIINYNRSLTRDTCKKADIYINMCSNARCEGDKATINKDFLAKVGVILIFCNSLRCVIKSDNNRRFTLQ